MLNLVLNIIGIILVIYSIIVIKKDISLKKDEEIKLIESNELKIEPYESIEEFIEVFDKAAFDKKIYQKTKKINQELKEKDKITDYGNLIIKEKIISKDSHISPLHKKIIELKSIGLDNEEIAKKLGRGIREIDIIIRIYET